MTYADQVRRARNALDYSQEALAIAACVSKRTIQNVEAGGNPGPETRRALAAVLGKALDDARETSPPEPISVSVPDLPGREDEDPEVEPRDRSRSERIPEGTERPNSPAPSTPRPRRRSIGERICPSDTTGASMLNLVVQMSVAMAIFLAAVFLIRHYTEPTIWVTVESTGHIVTTQEEAMTLSRLVEARFPDAGAIIFVSETANANAGIVRRTYGIVAHDIDSSMLMSTLAEAGLTVFVSTIDPVPPKKGIFE